MATGKPYRILGINHIAIGGTSRDALQNLWCEIFGLTKMSDFEV